MKHTDKMQEVDLSRRRNNRAIDTFQFHPQHQHKQHKKIKHQPELRIVDDEWRKQNQSRPVELIPKSLNQETYIDLLNNPSKLIIFATGPAGTGKTMLAVLAAIRAYQMGECKKIVRSE